MPGYIVSSKPPAIRADIGSGPWCSAPPTQEYKAYKRAMEFALATPSVEMTVGPDAVAHMRHYLNNTGDDHVLDMPALLDKSSRLRDHMDNELAQAKAFSETLGLGRHNISSSMLGYGAFRKSTEHDLFFAIGSYAYWGQGTLVVSPGCGVRYTLDFEFHFYDRYNWDKGKAVRLKGVQITDEFMQQFHRQCYAREFDIKGVAKQRLVWEKPLVGLPAALRNPLEALLKP